MLYETLKEWDTFVSIAHARVLTNMLGITRYAAYSKFSVPIKTLPKLMLHGKYGIYSKSGLKTKYSTWLCLVL